MGTSVIYSVLDEVVMKFARHIIYFPISSCASGRACCALVVRLKAGLISIDKWQAGTFSLRICALLQTCRNYLQSANNDADLLPLPPILVWTV